MAFTVLENLRGFFNSRPPLVVFMICLASFAISLITFAYIVKAKELPDPDITEDWNTFLEKFSHLQFCISHNGSSQNASLPKLGLGEKNAAEVYHSIHNELKQTLGVSEEGPSKKRNPEVRIGTNSASSRSKREFSSERRNSVDSEEGSSPAPTGKIDPVGASMPMSSSRRSLENVTVSLNFVFIPTTDSKLSPQINYGQFVAAVTAHMLKLDVSAKVRGDEQMSVFLSFPKNLSRDMCEEERKGQCVQYRVPACVTFQGSSHVLPRTQQPSHDTCPAHPDHPVELGLLRNARAGTLVESAGPNWCVHGSRLMPQYSLDDSLTVFLSMHDKSMINLHLMRTSYFLFVMVVTLFCYALIKGRPAKVKAVHVAYDKVSSQA